MNDACNWFYGFPIIKNCPSDLRSFCVPADQISMWALLWVCEWEANPEHNSFLTLSQYS